MPPQQPDRLLDLIDDGLNLGAHCDPVEFLGWAGCSDWVTPMQLPPRRQ
jgi:hypothetical protein